MHGVIEFGNRLLTFVLTAIVAACLVAVWRSRPVRPGMRALAVAVFLGIPAQALLGGASVLLDLHPVVVAAHFLLSMVLVAVSTVLLLRYEEDDGPARSLVRPALRGLAAAVAAVSAVVLVLGTVVTGAGPHSGGDADRSPGRRPGRFRSARHR